MKVITNHVPRDVIEAHELTAVEREQFDYLDWATIDDGADSARFFRYKGDLYDIGEFMRFGYPFGPGNDGLAADWDGYMSDSAFTATVVKYVENGERVIVGRVLS